MSKQEQQLIEHILHLLYLLQKSGIGITWLMEHEGDETPFPGISAQDVRVAQAFVKFLDEMPGGFLIYSAERGEEIIYANCALLRIFQCETLEEFRDFTQNSFRGLVHPDDLEAVEQSIWEQISASQHDLDYVEYRIRRKDGAIRRIEDYGHYIHNEPIGGIFYVFLGDATEKLERIQRERRLLLNEKQEGERKLKSLKESFDKELNLTRQEQLRRLEIIEGLSFNYESICYVDLDSDQIRPYRLSSRGSQLFNERFQIRSYSQYVNDYLRIWVHPEDRELVLNFMEPNRLRKRLEKNQISYINYRALTSGEEQYLQLQVVNISKNAQATQLVMGYRRVDEELQREMEQKQLLAEALDKANLAITAKDTFLSNMSHEMRTPLNAIFGYTSLAKMHIETPHEAMEYLNQVEAASHRLLDQITKVLEVSALSTTVTPAEVECDFCDILQEIYEFLQPQAEEKNIDFRLDCSGTSHNVVYVDQEKLHQLALYLANNAVTYTNTGGHVSITLTEGEELPNCYGVYHLIVKDDGIGISKEFLSRIFDPFSREKNSTLSGVHGIGLGLTIAKNIVDMMGGTIDVQSEEGKGSTFNVTFRLRFQPLSMAGGSGGAAVSISSLKLLLVEDNEINRELESELLEAVGFLVSVAEDGKVALDMIAASQPEDFDLILMDLQMPVMNGWEATAAIRKLPDPALAHIPIIALSANILPNDRRRSKEAGIDIHLTKPLDMSQLLEAIEQLTGKHLI